jgi:hypothetical protein
LVARQLTAPWVEQQLVVELLVKQQLVVELLVKQQLVVELLVKQELVALALQGLFKFGVQQLGIQPFELGVAREHTQSRFHK